MQSGNATGSIPTGKLGIQEVVQPSSEPTTEYVDDLIRAMLYLQQQLKLRKQLRLRQISTGGSSGSSSTKSEATALEQLLV